MEAWKKSNRIVWLLAASMVLLLVVAACSSDDDDDGASAQPAATAPTAVPTQVQQSTASGSLSAPVATQAPAPTAAPASAGSPTVDRLVFASTPPSNQESNDLRVICCFDPIQVRPMYENLVRLDQDAVMVPNLAESWALEPDGISLRVKLKQGIQFQDGYGEFTADDVLFNFNRLMEAETSHVFKIIFWGRFMDRVEKVNDYEVVYHMKSANTFLLLAISDRWNQMMMASEASHADFGDPVTLDDRALAGTGPYKITDREQQGFVRFERATDDHWRHTPDFPELEIRWISEPSTRLAAFLAGEAQMASIPPDLQAQPLSDGAKILSSRAFGTRVWAQFYCCWPDRETGEYPLFKNTQLEDVRVRQALNQAVNRAELTTAFAPHGELMEVSHYHSTFPGWNGRWATEFNDKYGYDPAAARALLADAGYNSSNPLEITTRVNSCAVLAGCADIGESLAGYWSDIGVDVNIIEMDGAAYGSLGRATRAGTVSADEGVVDWVRIDNSSTHPTFALWNRQTWLGGSGASGFATPDIADIIDASIVKEMDWAKHGPALEEIGNWAFDNFVSLPLWYLPAQVVVDPDVIADWRWNGVEHGTMTHLEEIQAVLK